MKFYHYNSAKLDVISSRAARDASIANSSTEPYAYGRSISLFLEPIPRNLASILNNEHIWWKHGSEWIEHVIDESAIPTEVNYRIVETPVMGKFYDQFDWTINDKEKRKQWMKQAQEEMHALHLIGDKRSDMVAYSRPFARGIEKYYKEMYKLNLEEKADPKREPDWPDFMKMYAPHIPHVILYTLSDLKVESKKQIKLT